MAAGIAGVAIFAEIVSLIERAVAAAASAAFARAAIEGAKTISTLKDPAALRAAVDFTTDIEIPAAAAIAAALKETGPLDFSLGILLSNIVDPIVKARLTDAMKDNLENVYRYGSLAPAMFLRRGVVEAFSIDDLEDSLIDSGFKDKEIAKVLRAHSLVKTEIAWDRWTVEDKAVEQELVAVTRSRISDLRSEAKSLSREIEDIEHDTFALGSKLNTEMLKEERREITRLIQQRLKPPKKKKP